MPECLNNGEGLFPGYYDPLYDQAPNPFEPGHDSLDNYIQTKAIDILGKRISPEKLINLKKNLQVNGILFRNIGDPTFTEAVVNYLKKIKIARKIIKLWS